MQREGERQEKEDEGRNDDWEASPKEKDDGPDYENRVGEGGNLGKVGQVDFFSIVTYFPIAKVALF